MAYINLLCRDTDGKVRFAWPGVKCYEIENDTPVIIIKMAKILKDRFCFEIKRPISGMTETVISGMREDVELLLGYDSATGTYVQGNSRKGESRIEDFIDFLQDIFDEPVFQGYVRVLY